MANQSVTIDEHLFAPIRRGFFADFFIRLFKEKHLGAVGGIICLILLITGIFANFLAPYGYNDINPLQSLKPPSAQYWFGTDNLGRDILSRIIYGGPSVGDCRLCRHGHFDHHLDRYRYYHRVLRRQVRYGDAAVCGRLDDFSRSGHSDCRRIHHRSGIWQIILVLALQFGIAGSRIIRGSTIAARENMYVRAADALGASTMRLLWRHILPNIMAPIIILFTTRVAAVVLSEATLSFLGLGIPPPAPSWGGMLSGTGRQYMLIAPMMALIPGLALTIVVYGINVFGDAMRDFWTQAAGRRRGVIPSRKEENGKTSVVKSI